MSTSSDTLVLLEDKCASPLKLLLTARVTCRLLPRRDIHDRDGDDCDEDGDVDYYVGDDCDDDDIYIMMQCLFVCHEKSSLPPGSLL